MLQMIPVYDLKDPDIDGWSIIPLLMSAYMNLILGTETDPYQLVYFLPDLEYAKSVENEALPLEEFVIFQSRQAEISLHISQVSPTNFYAIFMRNRI